MKGIDSIGASIYVDYELISGFGVEKGYYILNESIFVWVCDVVWVGDGRTSGY